MAFLPLAMKSEKAAHGFRLRYSTKAHMETRNDTKDYKRKTVKSFEGIFIFLLCYVRKFINS